MSARPPVPGSRRALIAAAGQPTILAFLVALGVTLLLALLVLGPWASGDGAEPDADATRLAAVAASPGGPTPTPRAIRTAGRPPASLVSSPNARRPPAGDSTKPDATAAPPAIAPRAAVENDRETNSVAVGAPRATEPPSSPTPTEPPAEPTAPPKPTATPEPEPIFEAASVPQLTGLAGGSWTIADGQLLSAGPQNAEPWLVIPETPPSDNYALEAEIRVRELVPGVCAQSFGLVAGNPAQSVFGGGIFYPCQQPTRARLTDVTNAADGYNGDVELAAEPFTLAPGSHTLRLEVRGEEVRLLIDGKTVTEATVQRRPGGSSEQVGIWSQGVRLAVRRVAIFELPDPD